MLRGKKLNSTRPTVMLSPPKPLDEIQPYSVCVCYSHEWAVQQQTLFLPRPLGSWAGSKGHISLDFNNKVSKGAKIRNRYNQVPHLTQDINGKVTNSQ